jgi:curved DNA-binding protein CbpA
VYPFAVLDVPEDATDAQVEAAYQALLRRHPPDRDPVRFRLLHRAYEALRTACDRRETRLFHFDARGTALTDDFPTWAEGRPRRRLDPDALAELLRKGGQ